MQAIDKSVKSSFPATLHGVVFDVLCFGHHRQSVIGALILTGNAVT
jgi:hypothetical protein